MVTSNSPTPPSTATARAQSLAEGGIGTSRAATTIRTPTSASPRRSTNSTPEREPPETACSTCPPGRGVRARHQRPRRRRAQPGQGRARSPDLVIEKPYGRDLRSALPPRRDRARQLRRAAGLPDRPLPGQGHRPERHRAAFRQLDLPRRSGTAALGRPRADHRGRDPRCRHSRGSFYESAGAMRDILQNHVLQVLALVADGTAGLVRRRGRAQREGRSSCRPSGCPPTGTSPTWPCAVSTRRGGTRDELMAGYRDEPGVDPLSRTETYAAMQLNVDNWRWAGRAVLRAHRQAAAGAGDRGGVAVSAPAAPADRPTRLAPDWTPDALILRVQPNEGISLRFGAKVPGHSFRCERRRLDFSLRQDVPRGVPRPTSGSLPRRAGR